MEERQTVMVWLRTWTLEDRQAQILAPQLLSFEQVRQVGSLQFQPLFCAVGMVPETAEKSDELGPQLLQGTM